MHLHASNIFNIQQWLDNDDTPYLKVHVWESMRVVGEIPSSNSTTVNVLTLVRDTAHLGDRMMEYAHTIASHEPVVFGKPVTIEEYRARRERGVYYG